MPLDPQTLDPNADTETLATANVAESTRVLATITLSNPDQTTRLTNLGVKGMLTTNYSVSTY